MSSSSTYGLMQNTNNDRTTLFRTGTGELMIAQAQSTLRVEFSPTFASQYFSEGLMPVAYSRASGNQVNNAGTDYRNCGYMAEIYMSPSQILYWYPLSGAGQFNGWDVTIIEEAGS